VSIAEMSWNPFAGELGATGVTLGADTPEIGVGALAVKVALGSLVRGNLVLESVAVQAPRATLVVDDDNSVHVLGLPRADGTESEPFPALDIREFLVTEGELTLRHPARGGSRDTRIEIRRLAADDIVASEDLARLALSADIDALVDGTPLRGKAAIRRSDAESSISIEAALTGLRFSADTLPLPAALVGLRGEIDVRGVYGQEGATGSSLALDVRIGNPRFAAEGMPEFSATQVLLPRVRIDFAGQTVDLGSIVISELSTEVGLAEREDAATGDDGDPGEASDWTVQVEAIELERGTFRIRRDEEVMVLLLESARWSGFGPEPTALAIRAGIEGGGTLEVEGTLGLSPLQADVEVRFAALELPLLTRIAGALPVAIAKGTAEGTLQFGYADGFERVGGSLRLHDLHSIPPRAAQPIEVLAAHLAEAEFALDLTASPPRLDIDTLKLSYPYAMIHSDGKATFPFSLLSGEDRGGDGPAMAIRLDHLEIEAGKLEVMVTTFVPPFWSALTNIDATATEIDFPEATVATFQLAGMHNELSQANLSGSFTSRGLEAEADVKNLMLESLNAYIAPLLGYKITRGRLALDATVRPVAPNLDARAVAILRNVRVEQTGTDIIQGQSGVPLPIALSLITKPSGEIELRLPLTVDTGTGQTTLGSMVGQSIRGAIVGALTSPLRLLGNLFGRRGAPHAFAIDPIPFAAGSGELDSMGWVRVEQIARIVQTHGRLAMVLMPQITAEDIAEVGAANAEALANERAAAARDAIDSTVADPTLDEKRMMLVPWTAKVGAEPTGKPGVYIELQEAR
jgi:hypothetical protein